MLRIIINNYLLLIIIIIIDYFIIIVENGFLPKSYFFITIFILTSTINTKVSSMRNHSVHEMITIKDTRYNERGPKYFTAMFTHEVI